MTPTDAKPVDALIPPLRGKPQRAKGKIESGHASEKEKKSNHQTPARNSNLCHGFNIVILIFNFSSLLKESIFRLKHSIQALNNG